ncbi:hypothetical protein [Draconibacterium sediminis]|uniref:hypothetical protein n=1 Tax=Draconibacterium sediminis TaxID=1544798 RepID=UPI0026EF5A6C|nr:hypothetical protein [Draconibacterium sediminis]
MKKKKLIWLTLTIIIFTSCNFSYSGKKEMRTKNKSIDGVDYMFANYAEYKNTQVLFAKGFQFKSKISFYGMEKAIEKEINKSDFEKKIDFDKIEAFHIDSVSFSVNENKDKVDLIYYLDLGNKRKMVTIGLEKDNEIWSLN